MPEFCPIHPGNHLWPLDGPVRRCLHCGFTSRGPAPDPYADTEEVET